MYKINDLVIYRRDVCRVVGQEVSPSSGEDCYVLTPYETDDGSVRMLVPVSNKGGHLRDVITPAEAELLMENLDRIQPLVDKPANMKSQYVAMLKGDDIEDLIRVIKTAYMRNRTRMDNHKKLAAIDGEYLGRAQNYLLKELSVSYQKDYKTVEEDFLESLRRHGIG